MIGTLHYYFLGGKKNVNFLLSVFFHPFFHFVPWQNLHFTFISVTVKCWANLCLSSITPSTPETLCLVQSSIFPPSVFFFFWKVKNTLAFPSFENRAAPSELSAERYVRRILKKPRPSGYADSVSPFLVSKNKGIPEKNQGRTSPQATTTAATPTSLSRFLSL